MKKAKQPTSKFQVFCDTFDMKGEAEIHETEDGKAKLLISLTSEDGKVKQSLSLYREDVEMLASFINSASYFIENRNNR